MNQSLQTWLLYGGTTLFVAALVLVPVGAIVTGVVAIFSSKTRARIASQPIHHLIWLWGAIGVMAGFIIFGRMIIPLVKGDNTAGFAEDLSEFVYKHDGRLPQDWPEFCNWMEVNKKGRRWDAKDLEERFVILIHKRQNGEKVPHYIEIIDPAYKSMTNYVNRRIHVTQWQGVMPSPQPTPF